jgi:glycogen debranching enzyme
MVCPLEIAGSPFGPYKHDESTSHQLVKKVIPGPLRDPPKLETNNLILKQAYDQAVEDLQALSIKQDNDHYILAAGIPWFVAIFGRDSIISALQTKLLGPELMIGTLHTLAGLQSVENDSFRDAEPGKLPHEVRKGELSFFEQVPHTRYYGSVDVTPLYLILIWEAFQWTGNKKLLERFLPSAELALQWIKDSGDIDGDGFVEYQRRAPKGLRNQGWKDSSDSINFAGGELADRNIALAEVQGYVYDAKVKMARMYRILGQASKAQDLESEARLLRQQFNQAFWMPKEEYFGA